jgi:predicted DCC family thiol-disulfide oxidoreductase YuxK
MQTTPDVHAAPRAQLGNTRYDCFKAQAFDTAIYPLTLYYESACPLCNAEMTNLMLRNTGNLLVFKDISAPGFDDVPAGTRLDDLLGLIHARRADDKVVKGVEVFRLAYQAVGLNGIATALRLPVVSGLAERAYPWLARNRHRVPRMLVAWLFEGAVRRAAERSASMHCTGNACTRPETRH